ALRPSFPYAVGCAQRALGRAAHQRGNLAEADARLREALATFCGYDGRFDVARTRLDLAALAHAQGDRETAIGHLREARMLFGVLRVPTYVERAEAIARTYGASLAGGETAGAVRGNMDPNDWMAIDPIASVSARSADLVQDP